MSDRDMLPAIAIEGQDLVRNTVRLPHDLPPGPCILLFAFSPTHQSEATSWVPALTEIVTGGSAAARQVIVLPGFAKKGERIVFDQLFKTVPPEAHTSTIVAFTDPGAAAKSAGATDTNHIALALLDSARRVAWSASGPHTPEREAALRSALAAAS